MKELEFENDSYHRPHAFDVGVDEIEIPMMPLVPVSVTVTDDKNVPVRGLDVATSPNVGWVQPIGTERLGDWDKLAGVVYGCSTVEGRRILALPGMKEKCDAFVERFSDAKNRKDPALLAEAYLMLADAAHLPCLDNDNRVTARLST